MLESTSPHVVSSKDEAINYIYNYLSVLRTSVDTCGARMRNCGCPPFFRSRMIAEMIVERISSHHRC
jgi:hypothetical protein